MSRENPKDTCSRCQYYDTGTSECRAGLPRHSGKWSEDGIAIWTTVAPTQWCRQFKEISIVTKARENR